MTTATEEAGAFGRALITESKRRLFHDSTPRIHRCLGQLTEEERADLLFAVEPATGEGSRNLYFPDEVPAASNELTTAGKKTGENAGGKQPGVKPS